MEIKSVNTVFSLTKVQKFLALAIGIHIVLEFLFPSMYGDQFMQINTFNNFVSGHGMTENIAYSSDLSQTIYRKFNLWPFGFIAMNYPLWYVFRDISVSTFILNSCFIVLFFYSIYKILSYLDAYLEDRLKITILLFFSICIMPSRYLGATDVWCLGLLLYCLYLTMDLIIHDHSDKKTVFFTILKISMSVLIMVSSRYSYWLFIGLCPMILFIYGFIANRKFLSLGLHTLLLSCLLSFGYIYLHYWYFGKIMPSSLPEQPSLQWETLRLYNPIFFNAFFRDSIARNLFLKIVSNGVVLFQIVSHVLSLCIFILILIGIKNMILNVSNDWRQRFNTPIGVFLLSSILLMGINNITLIYSTLKIGYIYGVKSGTYPLGYSSVAEVRYFAPSLILIVILFYISYQATVNSVMRRFYQILIISSFIFALSIYGLFLASRFGIKIPNIHTYVHYDQNDIDLYQTLMRTKKSNALFLSSPDTDLLDKYMFLKSNITEVKDADWNHLKLHTSSNVEVFAIISSHDTTLNRYRPDMISKSIKPHRDLIRFSVAPVKD